MGWTQGVDVRGTGCRVGETQRTKDSRQIFWKQSTEASREGERNSERSLKQQPPIPVSTNTQSTQGLSGMIEERQGHEGIPGGKKLAGDTKDAERAHTRDVMKMAIPTTQLARCLRFLLPSQGPRRRERRARSRHSSTTATVCGPQTLLSSPHGPQPAHSSSVMGCGPHHTPFNSDGLHTHFLEMRPSKRPLWFSGCNLCHPLLCLRCPQDGGWVGVDWGFAPPPSLLSESAKQSCKRHATFVLQTPTSSLHWSYFPSPTKLFNRTTIY